MSSSTEPAEPEWLLWLMAVGSLAAGAAGIGIEHDPLFVVLALFMGPCSAYWASIAIRKRSFRKGGGA